MPRGVRKEIDFNREIEQIDEKIRNQTEVIKSLKTQKKDLLAKKQEADMKILYDFINKEGKSASEILEIMKNK